MPRTKTVFDAHEAGEPAPQGGTFLERALERALSSLDRDAELSDEAREAAKAALAAALTCEIRDVLRGALAGGPAPRARQVGPARMFVHRAEAARPGYFHEPAAVIGLAEATSEAVRMRAGAATWMRLMPAYDPGRTWSAAALRAALKRPRPGGVLPIFAAAGGTGELKGDDGVGVYAKFPSATESSGVVFAFSSGEVWSLDTYVQDALSKQQPNAILPLEPELTAAFARYVDFLERLGAPKPYRWIIGMDGLLGRSMALPDGGMAGLLRGEAVVNCVVTEGEYDGREPPEQAIVPFFDDLFRACNTAVG